MLISSIGPFELAIIFLAIIVIFGIEKLPELAQSIVQGLKEFRKTINSID